MDINIRTDRKAKSILNKMLLGRQISPEGLAWLTVATDPFHDSEVSCSGYPDISTSRSLVQTFTQTIPVSKPGGVTDGTWDCHTFFNPCTPPNFIADTAGRTGRFYLTNTDSYGLVVATGGGTGMPTITSGVVAVPVPTGNNILSDNAQAVDGLAPPINPLSGPYRVIAVGYEVVNTTADLYKQGSVTVYKSPGGVNVCNLTVPTGTSALNSVLTEFTTAPPQTQAQAALYPNSRTWEAKEGCYIIPTMNDKARFVLPTQARQAGLQIFRGTIAAQGTNFLPYMNLAGSIVPGSNDLLPFDVCGAIFTGLHPQTTLQITARYVIERVPNISEPDLLVLTRVPCTYDPMILELYSRVMALLPVGCMVRDNPLGEWFGDVLSLIGTVAPQLGDLAGNFLPGAQMIGRAVGSAANAGRIAMKRTEKSANVPASPNQNGKKKNPPQPQNKPGTGKRAKKKAAAQNKN